jgi:basic membrane protein A
MRKASCAVILAFASMVPLAALPKVAVLDISAQAGIDASVVVPVTETIMEEVVGARAYVVLDRAYVEQTLKEMEFELSGLVGDSQAAKAGQFLGADYVVAGKVQMIGDAYFLVAKMIEVRTGVIVAQSSEQGEGKLSTLLGMSRQVGRKLVGGAPVSPLEPAARPGATSAAPSAATAAQPEPAKAKRIKAGFVIPTPARDANFAMVAAINRTKSKHSAWLDVAVADEVSPETCAAAIEKLIDTERCDMVFICGGQYAEQAYLAALRYPKTLFEAMDGWWKDDGPANLSVYGMNDTKFLYLQGLVAGSLTASGKIGVFSESTAREPWWYQIVDRFALGVKAANPKAQILVNVRPSDHWSDIEVENSAARALVAQGCDFLWGNISIQVCWALEELAKAGTKVRAFDNEFIYTLAPSVLVSSPLRDYTVFFDRALLALKEGRWEREAFWAEEASKFGGGVEPFNPAFVPELKAKKIKTPDHGTVSLLELLDIRAAELASNQFEIFTGPIKDQKGTLRIKAGTKADWKFIEGIDWYVDNVKLFGAGR